MDIERGCPYRIIMNDKISLEHIGICFITRRVKGTHSNGAAFCRWLGYFHRKKKDLLIQELQGDTHGC